MVIARCHDCHQDYSVQDEYRGMRVRCPRGHTIKVPAGSTSDLASMVGRIAARWAFGFGIAFYALAFATLLGGLFAAFVVGDLTGGGAFMTFFASLIAAMFCLATGMMLHMLWAITAALPAR